MRFLSPGANIGSSSGSPSVTRMTHCPSNRAFVQPSSVHAGESEDQANKIDQHTHMHAHKKVQYCASTTAVVSYSEYCSLQYCPYSTLLSFNSLLPRYILTKSTKTCAHKVQYYATTAVASYYRCNYTKYYYTLTTVPYCP